MSFKLIGHQALSSSGTFVIHGVDLKIRLSIDVNWNCEFVRLERPNKRPEMQEYYKCKL